MRKISNDIEVFLASMQQRLFLVVFLFFCFIISYEAKHQIAKDIPYILSQYFDNNAKPPIIVYLEPKTKLNPKLREFGELDSGEMEVEELEYDDYVPHLRTSQKDERAYILYHLLRTTLEDEAIDPEAVNNLQFTKELLRQALIGRCKQLNKCVRKCPKVSYTCTMTCKQIFDDLDACDEPKPKCKQPKCGHTMPPSWLL